MWKTTRQLALRRVPWHLSEAVLPPLLPGRWYGPSCEAGSSTVALVANRLYAMPILIPVTTYCQAMGLRVTGAVAGSNVRVGLYADNGGVPGALIVDAGVVNGALTEDAAIVMTNWLRAGWYWLACLSDNTPTVTAADYDGQTLLGVGTNTETDINTHVYAAQAYGALPANFPAPTYGSTGRAPRVCVMGLSGMEELSDGWRTTEDVEYGTDLHPPHVSGRYYGCPLTCGNYSAKTFTLVADRLYVMPFLAPGSHAYDRISIHVTTAGAAGKLAELGIYNDSGGMPGSLVLDAGNITVASTGGKEINIAETLARGWYWLACVSNGTPILRTYVGQPAPLPWLGFNTGQDTTFHYGMSVAQAYGALPANFPGGAILADVPRILLRAT